MMKKALFFDIDGTLLSEKTRTVPESAKLALDQTRALGNLVFINTGRPRSIVGTIEKLVDVDGWVCGCGTYIEANGETLYHTVLDLQLCKKIRDLCITCKVDGFLEGKDGYYAPKLDPRTAYGKRLVQGVGQSIKILEWTESTSFDKFCIIADEESDKERFFSELKDQVDVIDRGRGFYECVPKGHSKASGIDVICNHYGLTLEDAYVFGDSSNDLSMFEHVPNAILMEHHDKQLEPYASFITKAVEEDGIWFAMDKLGLL